MPDEFGDSSLALRMRDVIQRLVRETVDQFRPPDRFGRVIDVNRFFGRASVLINGDTDPISVKMNGQVQPLFYDAKDGAGLGSMVRVSGQPGNYWITQIMSGTPYSIKPNFFHPKLWGGDFFQQSTASYHTVQAGLPAIGNVWHFGRFENPNSFGGAGTGFLDIVLKWTFFTANVKTYQVPIRPNATNGAWVKLAPMTDSGDRGGHDMELEIMVDNTGFELRYRRMNFDPGGFTPGGPALALWSHGDNFEFVNDSELGEQTVALPNAYYGVDSANTMKGPFASPGQWIASGSQFGLSGATDITWDGTNVNWTVPFRVGTLSQNQYLPGGFYDIPMASNGTVLGLYGNASFGSRSANANGLNLGDGEALYAEVTWGDASATTLPGTALKIVGRTATARQFQVPSNWVLLCFVENGRFTCLSHDDWRPKVQLVQGTAQTGWVTSTWNSVTFSATDILDTHAMHSTSTNNNRINIGRMKGWWQIGGMYAAASNSAATLIRSAIALNGTRVPGSMQTLVFPSTGSVICTVSNPIWIEATSSSDWVELQAMETGASGTLGTAVTADNASALWAIYGRP